MSSCVWRCCAWRPAQLGFPVTSVYLAEAALELGRQRVAPRWVPTLLRGAACAVAAPDDLPARPARGWGWRSGPAALDRDPAGCGAPAWAALVPAAAVALGGPAAVSRGTRYISETTFTFCIVVGLGRHGGSGARAGASPRSRGRALAALALGGSVGRSRLPGIVRRWRCSSLTIAVRTRSAWLDASRCGGRRFCQWSSPTGDRWRHGLVRSPNRPLRVHAHRLLQLRRSTSRHSTDCSKFNPPGLARRKALLRKSRYGQRKRPRVVGLRRRVAAVHQLRPAGSRRQCGPKRAPRARCRASCAPRTSSQPAGYLAPLGRARWRVIITGAGVDGRAGQRRRLATARRR